MQQSAEKRMGVSDARANMTEVIAEVRLLGAPVVLTRREKPQAVLVSVSDYEQAIHNREVLAKFREFASLPDGVEPADRPDLVHRARIFDEAFQAVERDVRAARNVAES
ncbi:type II toxin-antitoxin system Phd/YefM family antitoxin [Streptomyces silvensis]|uniref:Antitoxin n=1 Tax=Streptomyces silvensis TaxID=1765722 RepID=A0A0W7X6U9_9ACTN|nr:type II toxin-antitoxin system Phd/YefM family antitoxin [Streptomyces silvensis]KUF18426.1 hypothetical protein AT728_18935 [Streptomyces silvensis]